GLEDSLFLERGVLARSNAEQVARMRDIVERMGRPVATPSAVRTMLRLKGTDATAIPR
ncbi:MAG: 3-keto-5-aminohexanoate cleavage protein, partial [Pseudomonadota bacterium]